MKLIIITFCILILSSCTVQNSNTSYKEEKKEVTDWHTWNTRYVSKTVDGDVTCYSHSEGGIYCFKDNTITK